MLELYGTRPDPHHTYGFLKCCEAVRDAVPIEKEASRYTPLRQVGDKHLGLCPLHTENTPSFYCYPDGHYQCFGCGAHGDVIDLRFHCGDYGELWEAMIDLSLEYGVELPRRPESWNRRQERQKPIRAGMEAAKIHAARRRLYRRFFEPLVLATEDHETRAHDAQLFWELTEPLAEHLVATMMGSQGDG